jgi:hypothetical protein
LKGQTWWPGILQCLLVIIKASGKRRCEEKLLSGCSSSDAVKTGNGLPVCGNAIEQRGFADIWPSDNGD